MHVENINHKEIDNYKDYLAQELNKIYLHLENTLGGYIDETIQLVIYLNGILGQKQYPKRFDLDILTLDKKNINNFTSKMEIVVEKNNKEAVDEFIEDLTKRIKETQITDIFESTKHYIIGLTKEEVENAYKKFVDTDVMQAHEWLILNQLENNKIPSISYTDFLEKYPDFKDRIDKDGLIRIGHPKFDEINEWGLFYKNYFINFDEVVNDGELGSFTIYNFLDFLFSDEGKSATFWIKPNFKQIISKKFYKKLYLDGAAYYGRQFDKNNLFDGGENLFTRKVRANKKFNDRMRNRILYTDFYIDRDKNSFSIEEVSQDVRNGLVINRLIHCEMDKETKTFSHFDGSYLYYSPENAKIRELTTLEHHPKLSYKKDKIFRIDGKISYENYLNITLGFFRSNELILEYFDIDQYKDRYKDILDYEAGLDY